MPSALDKYVQSIGTNARPEDQPWQDPIPLVDNIATPERFPSYALPDVLREAVEEMSDFTKAPIGMIASSALSSLSIACQAYVDVSRGHKLYGPSSLFFLVIADPNERKSSVDKLFQEGISRWESERIKLVGPDMDAYHLQERAWNAKSKGLEAAITEQTKKGRDAAPFEADLLALQDSKPVKPKSPVLIRIDDTQEALAYGLSQQWPSCGIVSSEGALTLGSHSMTGDSMMRTLGLWNVLWDGGTYRATRISREDIYLHRVRLSVSIMIQEKLFHDFVARSDGMARGSGFFGRFLTCWPYSTQGIRLIDKEITETPRLDAYNAAVYDLLNIPLPLDDDGHLTPFVYYLSLEAKTRWVDFYNLVERKLAPGDEFSDTKDVAGKLAENAVRMAALFQFFADPQAVVDMDTQLHISESNMERGILIASWYANEARRVFGDSGLAEDLVLPKRLVEWLGDYCFQKRIDRLPMRQVRQYGPRGVVRNKESLDKALTALQQAHHVRLQREGRTVTVLLNPSIMDAKMAEVLG